MPLTTLPRSIQKMTQADLFAIIKNIDAAIRNHRSAITSCLNSAEITAKKIKNIEENELPEATKQMKLRDQDYMRHANAVAILQDTSPPFILAKPK